jgi:SPP1 gp7 family putative phage head morphogenesis protein
VLTSQISRNFHILDAWSRDKTAEIMAENYVRLNTPQPPLITGRPTPKGKAGELWIQTVDVRKNFNEGLIDAAIKRNVSLIDKAYKEHFDAITNIVKSGILGGKGHAAIAKELNAQTLAGETRAKFWARDQASKFFGETTKLRQQGAGIPGYVWRTVGDNLTRDNHAVLDGTYHEWNNPPLIMSGNSARRMHPGEDYNCRCWAEPAFGPEDADRHYNEPVKPPVPDKTPVDWSFGKSQGIRQRLAVSLDDSRLKQGFDIAMDEIEKVLNLTAFAKQLKKAVSVAALPKGGPMSNSNGVFSAKSGVIMLNPDDPFPVATFMHEFFHMLDFNFLRGIFERKALLNVIKNTVMYKNLLKEFKQKGISGGRREYLKYLMDEKELLARAFEQYIIDCKGLDPLLKSKMAKQKIRTKKDICLTVRPRIYIISLITFLLRKVCSDDRRRKTENL